MSDLVALQAMLDRCGIHHSVSTDPDGVEVSFSPDDSNWPVDGIVPSPNLTGDFWASIAFRFSPDGQLLNIHMTGD